jgi:hypothetical protein
MTDIVVWIPTQALGAVMSDHDEPFVKTTILPSEQPDRKLWWIWRNMKQGMLRIRGEEEPLQDLNCPIADLAGTEFELVPWTPEYDELRLQVQALTV